MSRLDGLAAQRAAMTPGPWSADGLAVTSLDDDVTFTFRPEDAEGIVAVVNAHDQLVAIARAAKVAFEAGDSAAADALGDALAAFEAGDPT